jgi:hypothetical protein
MQLRELDGQLVAHTSTIDVIKGEYLERLQEFLVSEQVANELKKYASFLAPNYWYLVINKDLSTNDEQLHWEITVRDIVLQLPIEGVVKFEDNLPVLAFSWE